MQWERKLNIQVVLWTFNKLNIKKNIDFIQLELNMSTKGLTSC
jgi:hypothetical protein